jgi:hypothetical protein
MTIITKIGDVTPVYSEVNLYTSIKEILDTNVVVHSIEHGKSGQAEYVLMALSLSESEALDAKIYSSTHKQIIDTMDIVRGKDVLPVSCRFVRRGKAYYVTNPL